MYWLAKNNRALRSAVLNRFDPRYWTINFPRPMMAAVTAPAADALRMECRFLRYEDLAGLIWASEDTVDHPLLAYETSRDYRNTLLTFRWRSSSLKHLDVPHGPTLTIEGRDESGAARAWYVRLWNYAAGTGEDAEITLDFNSLLGGYNLETDADPVYPADIDRMFISFVPPQFDGLATGALATPSNGWAELSNIRCSGSGSVINVGDCFVPPHSYRAATAYDDQYNLVPERVVNNLEALGYHEVINHYVGMSHYPALSWNELAGEGGAYLPQTNQAAGSLINGPTRTWHDSFFKAAATRDMRVIISLSFELFDANCPDEWKQRAHDGAPALTGWSPPSALLSPCDTDAMVYLRDIAVEFCALADDAEIAFDFQIGEPWWWHNFTSGGAPCFYDAATTAAFTAQTGLPVPTKHQSADETPDAAQQVYLDFLSQKLGEATLSLRDGVAAAYPQARQMLLFFTPQVLGAETSLMAQVNMPTAWAWPAFDVFQVEDYDFVTSGEWGRRAMALDLVKTQLGYGEADSHYLAGFALAPDDPDAWQAIARAAADGRARGYAQVIIWASPQIMRDGFTVFDTQEDDDMAFHDVLFPLAISLGAVTRPVYATQIIESASGREQRNSLWAHPRMEYEVGSGLRSLADVKTLTAFFHARRGQGHGFRFRDPFDHSTAANGAQITATDAVIGTGDGVQSEFQLIRSYGDGATRMVTRPVANTVKIALAGVQQLSDWTLSTAPNAGVIVFDTPPALGVEVTAGFEFDVPVRFAVDHLELSLARFEAGEIPDVPLIEIIDDRV